MNEVGIRGLDLDIFLGSLYARLGLNQNIWLVKMIQRDQREIIEIFTWFSI